MSAKHVSSSAVVQDAAAPVQGAANFIPAPPVGVKLPPVPEDFVPSVPGEFTAVVPRKSELSALPQALVDLGQFVDYALTLGATAPPYDEIQSSLTIAAQWSLVRQASSRWDAYAILQEGLSWKGIRAQMDSLRPAFALAAKRDPQLIVKFAGLAKLLGAKQAIAHRGIATRRANQKAKAEGKEPIHGKVGKKRQRAAEKAAYVASIEAAKVPAPVDAPPAPAPAPPVVAAPPAENGVAGAAPPLAANGAMHS